MSANAIPEVGHEPVSLVQEPSAAPESLQRLIDAGLLSDRATSFDSPARAVAAPNDVEGVDFGTSGFTAVTRVVEAEAQPEAGDYGGLTASTDSTVKRRLGGRPLSLNASTTRKPITPTTMISPTAATIHSKAEMPRGPFWLWSCSCAAPLPAFGTFWDASSSVIVVSLQDEPRGSRADSGGETKYHGRHDHFVER